MDKPGPLTIRKDVPQPSIERSIADATRTFFANTFIYVIMDHRVALTSSIKSPSGTIAICASSYPGASQWSRS